MILIKIIKMNKVLLMKLAKIIVDFILISRRQIIFQIKKKIIKLS